MAPLLRTSPGKEMIKSGVGLVLSLALFGVLDQLLGLMIPGKVLNVAFAVTATGILVGLVLVVYGTFARNRWVINFQQVNCPRCDAPVPRARKPKSRREMRWGGGTCDKCGCEIDKWGNPITT